MSQELVLRRTLVEGVDACLRALAMGYDLGGIDKIVMRAACEAGGEPIDVERGTRFDPHIHTAVSTDTDETHSTTNQTEFEVKRMVRLGWKFDGSVYRYPEVEVQPIPKLTIGDFINTHNLEIVPTGAQSDSILTSDFLARRPI